MAAGLKSILRVIRKYARLFGLTRNQKMALPELPVCSPESSACQLGWVNACRELNTGYTWAALQTRPGSFEQGKCLPFAPSLTGMHGA